MAEPGRPAGLIQVAVPDFAHPHSGSVETLIQIKRVDGAALYSARRIRASSELPAIKRLPAAKEHV